MKVDAPGESLFTQKKCAFGVKPDPENRSAESDVELEATRSLTRLFCLLKCCDGACFTKKSVLSQCMCKSQRHSFIICIIDCDWLIKIMLVHTSLKDRWAHTGKLSPFSSWRWKEPCAHTSLCTVKVKHLSEVTINKTHFWVQGDYKVPFSFHSQTASSFTNSVS